MPSRIEYLVTIHIGLLLVVSDDTKFNQAKSLTKLFEYMAMGKPIIACSVGEVRRMLGRVGILVEPGNFYSLAKGILRLLKNKALGETLGRSARQRVEEKYNWKTTISSLISAYNSCLIVGT